MPQWFINLEHATTGLEHEWSRYVLFITLSSLFAWIFWRILHAQLAILVEKTRFHWDNMILDALRAPVSTMIWCWPGTFSFGLILQNELGGKFNWLDTVKLILLISMLGWTVLRLITNIENYIIQQERRDATTIQAISQIARLCMIIIGILTIMQTLGLSLSGLLTFGGVGGLVVGLAAKDLLSNFFGGMMIYFDRPFKVGDWIRSPDRQIEGTVERIGWRMTSIRTFDRRPIYIPNSIFSNIIVENPSRMLNRRILETIGLRYDDIDQLPSIINDIKEMLLKHPEIDSNQTLMVNFDQFGDFSLNFFIYAFTKTVNWAQYHEIKQDILLKTMDIIKQNQADIAFPTQAIKLETLQNAGIENADTIVK